MSIQGIKTPFEAFKNIESITKPEPKTDQIPTKDGKGFGEMLSNAIKEVDTIQKSADQQAQDLVLGKTNNPHEAMIALEKADMAFQLMNSVRSKIIRAYEEVMRSQV